MEPAFKVGEWAMFGCEPVQIKEADDRGYTVSTGVIETSGRLGDRLYPMSLRNKGVADTAAWHKTEMHRLCRGINWPDLADWIERSIAAASDNPEAQKEFLETLATLHRELEDLQRRTFATLPHIRVFR